MGFNVFTYSSMCCDQHQAIGHDNRGNDERCPLCQAIDALEQITQVCLDNEGPAVRHNLALKFVKDVAAKTHASLVTSNHRGGENG